MPPDDNSDAQRRIAELTGMGAYDPETVERVHQENIRRSREALEVSKSLPQPPVDQGSKPIFGIQPMQQPRKVLEHEISSYQGVGGKKQQQRAQARKRRQIRNAERSVWDPIAPKEYHGVLNGIIIVTFMLGMLGVAVINGYL